MFGFGKSKKDYKKLCQDPKAVANLLYKDRTKTSEILGDEEFISAWLDSENQQEIIMAIRKEAIAGDVPSLKHMVWYLPYIQEKILAAKIPKTQKHVELVDLLSERVAYCNKLISKGIPQHYYAMMSLHHLYKALGEQVDPSTAQKTLKTLNEMVEHAQAVIEMGKDHASFDGDAGFIDDAKSILREDVLRKVKKSLKESYGGDQPTSQKKKIVGGTVSYGNSNAISDAYNSGVGFLQAGNTDRAMDVFSALVDAKHPSATYNLALLYAQGYGERLMLPEAPQLMRRAAELGHEGAARYYAIFQQFQGFDPEAGSGLSVFLNMVGDGALPLILINAIGMDLINRLGSGGNAYIFVVAELTDLIKITDRSQKFINELGFRTKKGADLNFLRQDKDPGPEVALVCQEKMSAIMRECVEDHGMSEATAIFIRFSVVGMICKAHELIEQRDLPSIEFYAD